MTSEPFRNLITEEIFEFIKIHFFPSDENIFYDFLIGLIVSGFFYFLMVYMPEKKKRSVIKNRLRSHYFEVRREIISIILDSIRENGYAVMTKKNLIVPDNFKKYFIENNEKRWSQFLNNLDTQIFNDIGIELKVLRNDVSFVLNNIYIDDKKVFDFFRRLSIIIIEIEENKFGDEFEKGFSRFLWQLLAGWSFVDGYKEEDIMESMIQKI